MIKLSLLIATTEHRKKLFNILIEEFTRQIIKYDLYDKVEILYDSTGKQMSIGNKRQVLLEKAKGEYIVFMDDDDWPIEDYLNTFINILENNKDIDCIGFKIRMTTNGIKEQVCDHSLRHKPEGWQSNKKGFDYIRNVTIFNPVRKELALKAGFTNLRFGEDHDYANKITPLCFKEYYIEEKPYMFWYRYSNAESHSVKYGENKNG